MDIQMVIDWDHEIIAKEDYLILQWTVFHLAIHLENVNDNLPRNKDRICIYHNHQDKGLHRN